MKICKHNDGKGHCSISDDCCVEGPCHCEELIEYESVRHGRWEETVEDWMMCSACGDEWNARIVPIEDFHYCPNCGAKMDKEAEK